MLLTYKLKVKAPEFKNWRSERELIDSYRGPNAMEQANASSSKVLFATEMASVGLGESLTKPALSLRFTREPARVAELPEKSVSALP